MNRIAKELLKIAKQLIADVDYIYDPEHKKKPAGGYHKTEKGWSKKEQKKDKSVKTEKDVNVKDYLNSPKGKHYLKHLELLKELKEEGMFQGKKYQTALNPKTSSKTLDKMSKDSSFKIRLFVSCNPNTSTETLDRLSENKEDEIRSHVARHPNTSMETLKKLSKDKQDYIVEYAKENLSKRKQQQSKGNQNKGIDFSKMTPELRQKIQDWDIEDIKKFINWLHKNGYSKGMMPTEEE